MAKLLGLRAQLIAMLAISIVLVPFIGEPMLIPAIVIALGLQGVQLEINRD